MRKHKTIVLKKPAPAPAINLKDGRKFVPQTDAGTWFVTIDGQYYCAADIDTLMSGLKRHGMLADPPKEVLPEISAFKLYRSVIMDPYSSLTSRQEARSQLMQMKDPEAVAFVQKLHNRPPASMQAQVLTNRLEKLDFADVTHEDLIQHVSNLVLRSKLIIELSERLRLPQ